MRSTILSTLLGVMFASVGAALPLRKAVSRNVLSCFACLVAITVSFHGFAAENRDRPPNIVIMLADDLAWADVGCYGSKFHETPRLDRLAAEGMRFTNGYAAHMSCSPSRAALLTGRYPARLKITAYIAGPKLSGKFLPAEMRMELPFEEITLAEVLKESGYATLFVGKWHLGDAPYFPEKQGFNVNIGGNRSGAPGSFFWPYGRDKKRRGYHGIEVPGLYQGGQKGEHLCDRLTMEALELVEANQDKPFFLYLSFYDVHTPIQAKQPLIEKYRQKARRMGLPQEASFKTEGTLARGTRPGLRQNKSRQVQNHPAYAAMVETLDTNLGRVLDGLFGTAPTIGTFDQQRYNNAVSGFAVGVGITAIGASFAAALYAKHLARRLGGQWRIDVVKRAREDVWDIIATRIGN